MSVLQSIQTALSGAGVTIGEGQYPAVPEPCGKVVFTGKDKPIQFMGGEYADIETFKVIVRGDTYRTLEQKSDIVRAALKDAGFIQIGGYEDIEPKEGETFMQLAVNFKLIKQN